VGLSRLGLIARADARGLAVQTKNFHDNYPTASTLVVTTPDRRWPDDPSRFPGAHITTWVGDRALLEPADAVSAFLDDVDTVFSVETLYCTRLADQAAARGIRTVIQGNPEFYRRSHRSSGYPTPDHWTWPTPWLLDHVPPGPVIPVPVSGRSSAVAGHPDDDTMIAVHVAGRRALGDRNGTELFVAALHQLDARHVHIRLYSQDGHLPDLPALGRHITVETFPDGVADRWTMYDGAHLLVAPRRYGGLSLPVLEAMESGLAVAMTDCPPNGMWPIVPIRAGPGRTERMPVGPVATTVAAPRLIALTIAGLARHRDTLTDAMTAARQWATANTWDVLRPRYERLLQ
jgi:glycosyltransferase involved in cell wall biosynthesis